MSNLQNVERIPTAEPKQGFFKRFGPKLGLVSTAGAVAVLSSSANAAGSVDGLFTSMSTELGGLSSGALTVITILAGVTALLIGWAYVRRVK